MAITDSHPTGTAVAPSETAAPRASPFFDTPPLVRAGTLAMLRLKRDHQLPLTIGKSDAEGYAEGAVTNTRFGSYPHSTLVGVEWGSQVRASKVDTGTRGRRKKADEGQDSAGVESSANGHVDEDGRAGARGGKKRKSDTPPPSARDHPAKKAKQQPAANGELVAPKAAVEAGSGFTHILQPTPEAWTSSLDHRTQVVYTPDYSYILQRLRVRPGDTIIEAGAGSGSFTHAAVRAVYSGEPPDAGTVGEDRLQGGKKTRFGIVYSYEFHEPRVETLRQELSAHGLDGVVQLTHRDVCDDGFALPDKDLQPAANAIFLDLPAPWLALRHLTRDSPQSPLNPHTAVHICTFSPCIEQVQLTVSAMRKLGWTEIEMVEIQHKRLDVRREAVGLKYEGQHGVNATAASVDEAISRLREVEQKLLTFHENKDARAADKDAGGKGEGGRKIQSKAERLAVLKEEAEGRKAYLEGELVCRSEPEVKTHTSYLVFATLPRAWSEEDEAACAREWPVDEVMRGPGRETDGAAKDIT